MTNFEQKSNAGDAKIQEYVSRIQGGEPSEEIMKGLPDSFRTAIEAKLNPEKDNDGESKEAVLLAQGARQETKRMAQRDDINSANRANEIRTELGLPIQLVEQPTIEAPDAEILSAEEQKARDIKAAFDAMGEALKGVGLEKVREYDERLRAAMVGKPIKHGDTVANLMPDFKRFTKIDWTPDFDVSQLTGEKKQEAAPIVPELSNIAINENTQLEGRKFDPSRFELKNENGQVIEYYQGAPDYKREIGGKLEEVVIGDERIKIIFSTDPSVHAAYEPSRDIYTIGPGAIEEFKKDPEMFLSSFGHEAAHDAYFSLPAEKQSSLDNLFLNNESLQKSLMEFAATLYSDKLQVGSRTGGELYLQAHDINNQGTVGNLLSRDASPGIKDFRSASFELNGSKHEIFLSLLITEMISYMSSLQLSENVYQKVAENGRQRRGGEDPRYDIVAKMFEAINNDPKIKAEFGGYGLFSATSEKAKNDLISTMEKSS